MSNINNTSARQTHVSPGIYSREIDLTYAVKSLGITTLGVVGETLRGPAFQPMQVDNWRAFQDMFGGTSTEKFKGSQYPKYELPYIAKSYLQESKQIEVCRVLGLSGYNAGPAWVVTSDGVGEGEKMVIAVLRSRGRYEQYHKYEPTTGSCDCPSQTYDTLFYQVGEIEGYSCSAPKEYNLKALEIKPYVPLSSQGNECDGFIINGTDASYLVNEANYGRFKLVGIMGEHPKDTVPTDGVSGYFEYPVSLNPFDKDYILKVLGTSAENGDAPIYVESLYDVALKQLIATEKVTAITSALTSYQVYFTTDYCGLAPVNDFITKQEESLSRKDVGKRLLGDKYAVSNSFHCHKYDWKTGKPLSLTPEIVKVGQIYTVVQYTDVASKRHYYYRYFDPTTITLGDPDEDKKLDKLPIIDSLIDGALGANGTSNRAVLVKNAADNYYYRLSADKTDIARVKCDLNDYKSAYRFASTPWVVSNIKGDFNKMELTKMFRFHTISDGNGSNQEIKTSITNIRPDEGVFDVIIRDINDVDESTQVLERFGRCSMIPGQSNYIAYKIGSYDGNFESKSKYVTVEVNETDVVKTSIPAGYLGYPLADYAGLPIKGVGKAVKTPYLKYNLTFDEDIKNKKQYFGLSSTVGVDIDSFTFKGNAAYGEEPEYVSQGFHLDSRLSVDAYATPADRPIITVDGVEGYKFDAVSTNNRTVILNETPLIGTEAEMMGSIYEYVDLRKFTMYFYGGFDGWDVYRDYRSNTDDFKLSKYRGQYNETSGEGYAFNRIDDPDALALNQNGITSDFYAYLSGIRQFSNPEAYDINVFATPGIDLVNNTILVKEAIEMIEEERADSIYVVSTPDKPFGSADYVDEMYSPSDVVDNLVDTEIDSNYTCTYYPWIKYLDGDNNQYIYLPPTKDVVRNMALTDNQYQAWFAPAGISRGDVECVRAHYVTKMADEDTLYDGRVNPVKTFATEGPKIWGQRNLQIRESQLNRIAVRRLLLRMRKLIAVACIGMIFEPNDATTKNKFLTTVTPIMDNIRNNRGLSDYRIEINDSIESRERRELPVKIYFKPYNALEYITIDFIVTPEGVNFDDI